MTLLPALLGRRIAITDTAVTASDVSTSATAHAAATWYAAGDLAYDTDFLEYEALIGGTPQAIGSGDVNITTDRMTWTAHPLSNGDPIRFTGGDMADPLVAGTTYYVVNKTTNDFQVSLTVGGAAVDITSSESGVTAHPSPASAEPLSNATYWQVVGVNNRLAMFDASNISKTENSSSIAVTVAPGSRFDSIALLGLSNVSQVAIAAHQTGALRTNRARYNRAFDNAWWTKTNMNITANAAAVPGGAMLMDRLVPTTASGVHQIRSGAATEATTRASAIVRADGYSIVALRESGTSGASAVFNVALGTVLASNNAGPCTVSGAAITADPDEDGAWRVSALFSQASTSVDIALYVLNAYTSGDPNSVSFAGDGTSGVYVRDFQIEGGVLTPPIPTEGSSVASTAHNYHYKVYDLSEDAFDEAWYVGTYDEPFHKDRLAVADIDPQSGAAFTVAMTGSGTLGCGSCVPALTLPIGYTELGASIGFDNYSVFERGAFGQVTNNTERGYSDRIDLDLFIEAEKSAAIRQLMVLLKDTLVVLLTYPDADSPGGWNPNGITLGWPRNFELLVGEHKVHQFALEVEGVA